VDAHKYNLYAAVLPLSGLGCLTFKQNAYAVMSRIHIESRYTMPIIN